MCTSSKMIIPTKTPSNSSSSMDALPLPPLLQTPKRKRCPSVSDDDESLFLPFVKPSSLSVDYMNYPLQTPTMSSDDDSISTSSSSSKRRRLVYPLQQQQQQEHDQDEDDNDEWVLQCPIAATTSSSRMLQHPPALITSFRPIDDGALDALLRAAAHDNCDERALWRNIPLPQVRLPVRLSSQKANKLPDIPQL
mmetsp:Transcript_22337/g.52561  ORF Transcript_22337/g.52561 Transcript_22337/m.52561 type:complete len:194 (-) Transcript_22337:142-723(-)|eukprot:CAMPEP_0168749222 /NCGR_PEP_ID=MMETSP0724-20121128/16594_1 /TAXON_ID=265536 /ORGANISM="Amphiprora sp., Strain CCMP467" /LENGTH=193 /DNA_ID=CAMNT_0008797103 /DNA_START=33 /DNA_END=614 /DNA_ORIENTATION=-